jgi:hypothetical protein
MHGFQSQPNPLPNVGHGYGKGKSHVQEEISTSSSSLISTHQNEPSLAGSAYTTKSLINKTTQQEEQLRNTYKHIGHLNNGKCMLNIPIETFKYSD